MKKNLHLFILLLASSALIQNACKKEDPAPIVAPLANFDFSIDGQKVTFTSTSANMPTIFDWDFGDGQTGAGSTVTHTYDQEDSFTVILTAKNDAGSNSISKQVKIGIKHQLIKIHTQFGDMVMWLYDETPQHKSNFLKLASEDFFDGTTFHRIIQNFVIQGGDPNSKDSNPGNDGEGGPGYTIPAEIKSDLKHVYGAVGAARDNNPAKASNGSQFYIVVNKSGTSFLNGNYTVFGQILSGMDVAEKIAVQDKDANDRPLEDITMDVNIIEMTKAEIKTTYNFDIK